MRETYNYNNDNMTIVDLYKRDMSDSLYMIYKDKKSFDEIQNFVNNIVDERYLPAVGHTRNIYKGETGTFDMNMTLKKTLDDKRILGSNGSLLYSPDDLESPTSTLLLDFIAKRKVEKNLAIKLENEGRFEEAKYKDNLSNTLKIYTNSGYGIQLMRGSFLYNTDSASIITGQARELISEMCWGIEKFLMSNMAFSDLNEIILYIKCTINSPFDEKMMDYIDKIPKIDDLIERYIFITSTVERHNSYVVKYMNTIERMFKNMNEKERVLFYYKNNFIDFVLNNVKIQNIFRKILESNVEFYDPYKIPEDFANDFAILLDLFDNFVINPILTHDRVNKYLTRKRHAILLSDTDSIMPSLNKQVELFKLLFKNIDFDNEMIMFKTVNLLTNFCTHVCDMNAAEYCKACNVPERYISRINMKNEFYFQRLIMYSKQKKNYSARKRMREGKLIPEEGQLTNVGRALRAASLNNTVTKMVNEIIENSILKAKTINPIEILIKVNEIEDLIRERLENGDKTFGILKRFSGEDKYKDVETTNIARMSIIWNRLYPLDPIEAGDMFYAFKTNIEKPEDCNKIQDLEIRAKVLDLIFDVDHKHIREFKNQDFSRFGLKEIGIPKIGKPDKIPDWLIPLINIPDLITQHTQPIISLLPSIGIEKSKIDSTKSIKSTLVSF